MDGLPTVEEGGDGFGAGVLELLFAFGVEKISIRVDYGEGGDAFGDGYMVFLRYIDVLVHVTDVDVDEDEIFGEEFGVGALAVVDVEELAVAAPVAAKVEEDAFVLAASLGESGGNVGGGVGGLGVEILVDLIDDLRSGIGHGRYGQCCEGQDESGEEWVSGFQEHGMDLIRVHRDIFRATHRSGVGHS